MSFLSYSFVECMACTVTALARHHRVTTLRESPCSVAACPALRLVLARPPSYHVVRSSFETRDILAPC